MQMEGKRTSMYHQNRMQTEAVTQKCSKEQPGAAWSFTWGPQIKLTDKTLQ